MADRLHRRRNQNPKLSKEEFSNVIKLLDSYLRKLTRKQRIRYLLIQKYGAKCKSCGIKDYRVLQLDHVKGGGEKQRKEQSNNHIYKTILDGGEPLSKYQLLCANCNWIKKYENSEL